MYRTSRRDAENAFERLIAAIGGRVAKSYNDVGAYSLDYNSAYGGFTVELVENQGGGVSRPFGHTRQSAREFCQSVRFATDALYHVKESAKAA